jgi:hypothetical protein
MTPKKPPAKPRGGVKPRPLGRDVAPVVEDQQGQQSQQDARVDRLNALGASLSRTRKDAIDARMSSGIEQIWLEDEEHYEGIDDANRATAGSSWNTKPPGGVTPASTGNTSTEFPNITAPYVDAAAAKVGGILLPTDERSWGLKKTPVPELETKSKGQLTVEDIQGLASFNATEQQALGVAAEEAKAAKAKIAEADLKAEKAQTRIEDWHVEGQWHAEVRKVIEDCCRLGSGVLKGPVPISKRAMMFKDGALIIRDEIKPISKRIDPWNFFPDGACGENIHNGNYVWERDFVTAKQLRELKRTPDYIESQIDKCLEEGPQKSGAVRKMTDGREISDKDIFEIWYFTGQAEKEDLEAAGCTCKEGAVSVPAIFTMVNDRVIKGALNPLDSGDFPYDVMPWKRRKNLPWGIGVSRQMRTPQRIVTAGTRVMLTNGGRAAGPIFILKNGVEGAHGNNNIEPWARFYAPQDENNADVRNSMAMFEIPDRFNSLMGIVQYGMKLAEDVTGLPLLLQGQVGNAPETYGGQQLANNNASETLRRVALLFDDNVTEPHVRRYYAWLLQYGEDDEKGEFVIDARGSTALVEREIYKTEVSQLLEASLNPAFGLDPAKVMAEHLRTTKKNPDNFQLTDEQKAQQAQAQQQGQQQDSSLQVAQIRNKTEIDKATLNQQADMAEINAKAAEADKQRRFEMDMQIRSERIEMMKLAAAQNISLSEIKAQLAGKTMTLNTQVKLSRDKTQGAPQVARPAVEPRGRAPAGQAFQK